MPKGVVMAALAIRQDYEPADLRRRAAHDGDRRAALRLLAIANALEGMPRAEAARLAGMERQALRDAVLRFNAEGPAGLHDKPRPGRPERLSDGQQAALKAHILRGPRPERDRKSTRLNSSHQIISYAVFCLKKKKKRPPDTRTIKQKKKQYQH